MSRDPVNQFFYSNQFRAHAARFAHELDAAMGHHTLVSASEEDRLTALNALSAMIGVAWQQYAEWIQVDPLETIVGGQFDGTLLWKRNLADYKQYDKTLCGDCDIATFARRFLFHANLPLFRRVWRQGLVYSVNRNTTPWEPQLFAVATQPQSEFYDDLNGFYHAALAHYDNEVGVADRHVAT